MKRNAYVSRLGLALLLFFVVAGLSRPLGAASTPSPTATPASSVQPPPQGVVAPAQLMLSLASIADPQMRRVASLAAAHLAGRLGLWAEDIQVISVDAKTWPDSCLGIPREPVLCEQVLTPGYRILLDAEDEVYEYRANRNELVVPAVGATRGAVAFPTPIVPKPTSLPSRAVPVVPVYRVVDRGIRSIGSGTAVLKGQVLDSQGRPLTGGRATP